jgi:ubiquitin C-terminal hydrolase
MVTHVEAQHDSNVSMQAKAKPTPSVSRDSDAEAARKADAEAGEAWRRYLQGNDSVVTDIFAGQLQNAIECLTCGKRWSIFEPFMDLSVPIPKARGRPCSRDEKGRPHAKCSLHDCLKKFVGEELLTGENMVMCDYCKTKRQCRKNMTIYKYPRVLVIHMKRFRYSQATREKVLTDVGFPLADLDMSPYTSADKVAATSATSRALSCMKIDLDQKPIYDLVGVSHHIGGMQGGHYAAHVNTGAGESRGGGASGLVSGRSRRSCHSTHSGGPSGGLGSGRESETTISDQTSLASGESGHTEARQRWICFNDARVTQVSPANLLGPSAYVLFYRLKESGESYC